jgi:hypothetical protein
LCLVACLTGGVWAQGSGVQLVEGDGSQSYRVSGVLTAPVAALATGEARIVFDYQDARNYCAVRLAREQAQFERVKDGKAQPLGVAGTLRRGTPPEVLNFSLQRGEWAMAFVCNQVVAARAEDRGLPPGRIGHLLQGAGLEMTKLSAPQAIEEIYFADDFMRADENLGGWEVALGKWQNNQQGSKTSRSANAFSFRSLGEGPSLAVHGQPFDREYVVQAAVRCDNDGAVGLAVGCQDPNHYYRLRWTAAGHADGGACRLQRVFGGKVIDLAPPVPGGFRPKVWYKLQLALAGGWLYGWIDDTPLFEVAAQCFAEGKVGLYTEPGREDDAETAGALFDDVIQRSWPLFSDDFLAPAAGRWTAVGAPWELKTGRDGGAVAPVTGLLVGPAAWEDPTFEADVTYASGTVGLVVGRQPDGRGYGLLMRSDSAQIVRFEAGGKRTVLATAAKGIAQGETHRLTLSADSGLLQASVDGAPVLDALDLGCEAGACGLLCEQAGGARFGRVRARFRPTFFMPAPTLPADFVQDRYMTSWASPGAAWTQVEGSSARWHKGFFYGDRRLHFQIPGVGKQEGKIVVALCAKDTAATDGVRVTLALTKESKEIGLAVVEGDKPRGEAKVKVEGETPDVVVELRGRHVVVQFDGKVVWQQALAEERT